jgi:hypothetical protein
MLTAEDIKKAARVIAKRESNKLYKVNNPEKTRISKRNWYKRWAVTNLRSAIAKRHGTTIIWYENKLKEQGGGCGICGTTKNGKRPLAIDHNHTTHSNRGILCYRCNQLVGHIENCPDLFDKIMEYLRKYGHSN